MFHKFQASFNSSIVGLTILVPLLEHYVEIDRDCHWSEEEALAKIMGDTHPFPGRVRGRDISKVVQQRSFEVG
jgi:hypothetical protein